MVDRQDIGRAVQRVSRTVDEVRRWRPARVGIHFANANGTLLAAGMAYQALFAVFAAVWLGFSVAGLWLRSNGQLYDALLDIVQDAVPGLIGPGAAIDPAKLDEVTTSLRVTGLIAAVGLLWTLIGWLASTRVAIRLLFDLGADPANFWLQKLRDFGLAAGFGVALVVSAVISVASSQALTTVLGWFGVGEHSTWTSAGTRIASQLVVLALNFAILCVMYRVLSRVVIPWRSLVVGSAIGAVALSIMSLASGLLLSRLDHRSNPLLSGFATFVGLLVWFNLICIVILFGAAWIAVGMSDRGLSPRRLTAEEQQHLRAVAEYRARLAQAQQDVAVASAAYDRARGWSRRRHRKTLFRAYQHLRAIRAADPDA